MIRKRQTAARTPRRLALSNLSGGVIVTAFVLLTKSVLAQDQPSSLQWQPLPSIPDPMGFAGCFAGVSGGALLVGGGANFPNKMPWDGGEKVWYDSLFVLPEPNGIWISGFKLPRALAYGVSITTPGGMVCAGGADAQQHFRDVILLQWTKGKIQTKSLPPLPLPMAYGCGALIGSMVYIAGGIERPDSTNALSTFWCLDLKHPDAKWRVLESWPGPARMLSVAGVYEGDFLLFSGVSLSADVAGKPIRRYLKDAHRFTPGKGWRQLSDLPRAAAAAPSPAIACRDQLLIVSGDDGEMINFEPKSAHPGFPKDVIAYEPVADKWTRLGESPFSRATTPVVIWRTAAVIPGGEVRPGRRTPELWKLDLK